MGLGLGLGLGLEPGFGFVCPPRLPPHLLLCLPRRLLRLSQLQLHSGPRPVCLPSHLLRFPRRLFRLR